MALVLAALVLLVGPWEPKPFSGRDGVWVASPSPVADVTVDDITEKIMKMFRSVQVP